MFGFLFALFVFLPLIEIFLLLKLGGALGGMNTFAIVIITGALGAFYAKKEGREVFRKIQFELQEGQMPDTTLLQGFSVLVGGILLVTPGFITDIMGFTMILPITNLAFIAYLKKLFAHAVASGNIQTYTYSSGQRYQGDFTNRPSSNNDLSSGVIEAEYTEKN